MAHSMSISRGTYSPLPDEEVNTIKKSQQVMSLEASYGFKELATNPPIAI